MLDHARLDAALLVPEHQVEDKARDMKDRLALKQRQINAIVMLMHTGLAGAEDADKMLSRIKIS